MNKQMEHSNTKNGSRRLQIYLLAVNIIGSFLTYIGISMAIGAGKTIIVSQYRELDMYGLTNKEAIQTYDNGRFAGAWTVIPDHLGEIAFQHMYPVMFLILIFFVINVILVSIVLWQGKKVM